MGFDTIEINLITLLLLIQKVLKFGQNQVSYSWNIVVVVVVDDDDDVVVVDPRNLVPLEFGPKLVSNSWDIAAIV